MINPVLAEMAVYPFTRLEEERRRLLAAGVDVIDFGKGDPNEPTDPMIRQALVAALPERAPYPLAQGRNLTIAADGSFAHGMSIYKKSEPAGSLCLATDLD